MSDPRFARLKSDPRFRRPKLKQTKVLIDDRFKSVFEYPNRTDGPKVDKYGRPVSANQQRENLTRYYRLSNHADDPTKPDLARGQILLESSDEDEGQNEEEDPGFVTLGPDLSAGESLLEVDLDEDNYADLDLQAETFSNAYPEQKVVETIPTSRLAIVNLDWDHIRAQHLYKICSSLVSSSAPAPNYGPQRGSSKGSTHGPVPVVRGQVRNVRVYPSEFGKKRIEREEKEGPPKEIFKKKIEGEVNERTVYELGDEQEGDYDEDALRVYQLERLRYYYAIVECDTVAAATHIYNQLEGTELERSANVFDLSFVPEDMSFDNEPRDEAAEDLNTGYNPVEFVTDALRHSKVKLTWDDDDPERHHATRRALTKKEIEEGDFRNYVAGSSSESSDSEGNKKGKEDKKAEKDKLRALLLGGNADDMPEGWGSDREDDVDMEITFMPALSKKVGEEETTLEKYQRKGREKRKKRKEGKGKEAEEKSQEDEFFEASGDDFATEKKGKNTSTSEGDEPRKEATAAELALLVAPDKPIDEPKHFNLKSVIKTEKAKKRKGKGKTRKGEQDNEAQEAFVMNVKDERFNALFEDHQFAVDPSNPHFKKTKAMTAILEERRRRRRNQVEKAEEVRSKLTTTSRRDDAISGGAHSNLKSLVESVKRKSANADLPGVGKRRKL